jgi:hypothetical protein
MEDAASRTGGCNPFNNFSVKIQIEGVRGKSSSLLSSSVRLEDLPTADAPPAGLCQFQIKIASILSGIGIAPAKQAPKPQVL